MSVIEALRNGRFELTVDNLLVTDGNYLVTETQSFGGSNPMQKKRTTRYTILHDKTNEPYAVIPRESEYYIASHGADPYDFDPITKLGPRDITPKDFDISPP